MAWRGKAQATIDNAHMRYFVVHLHRLMDPGGTGQLARVKPWLRWQADGEGDERRAPKETEAAGAGSSTVWRLPSGRFGDEPTATGRRPDLRTVGWLLLTMTIAAAGGALFAALGLPAPWLTGSMMAIVAAAMAGLPVGLPARLRDVAFVLLGISMGSSATPESVAQMQAWPGSLALLALSVVATLFAGARLPRAGPRLGPGHRALRLDPGRVLRGGRAGGHQSPPTCRASCWPRASGSSPWWP